MTDSLETIREIRSPLFTPTTTRDLHRSLIEWYGSREAQGWAIHRNDQSRDDNGADVELIDPRIEQQRLRAAETFLVTDEMSAVCRHAAASLPDVVAQHAMLPAEVGFMVFNDHPSDHETKPLVPMQAIAWYPGAYDGKAGVCLSSYLWPETAAKISDRMVDVVTEQAELEEYIRRLDEKIERIKATGAAESTLEDEREAVRLTEHVRRARRMAERRRDQEIANLGSYRFPAFPGYWTFLPYGETPSEMAIPDGVTDYMVRMMLSAWILMDQPLALRERTAVQRPAAKRAERAGLTSDITVITLRQPKHAGSGETSREYRSRWLVRGHWRRVPTPEQPTRVTWVHGYVKGPVGAPLVVKDRVTVLAR